GSGTDADPLIGWDTPLVAALDDLKGNCCFNWTSLVFKKNIAVNFGKYHNTLYRGTHGTVLKSSVNEPVMRFTGTTVSGIFDGDSRFNNRVENIILDGMGVAPSCLQLDRQHHGTLSDVSIRGSINYGFHFRFSILSEF